MLDDKKCNPAHLFLDGIFGVYGKIVYFCRLMMRCVAMVADRKLLSEVVRKSLCMLDFDYYIQHGEPSQREKAEAWAFVRANYQNYEKGIK